MPIGRYRQQHALIRLDFEQTNGARHDPEGDPDGNLPASLGFNVMPPVPEADCRSTTRVLRFQYCGTPWVGRAVQHRR